MSTRFKDFGRLGGSLRRVRVADRPLEGGGKKVWHQGEGGAEIISFVDAGGGATRQECYLEDRVVIWQMDAPVATGRVTDVAAAGEGVEPDAQVSAGTVLEAVALLEGFTGDDKYLEHFRAVLRLAAQKLPVVGLDPAELAALRRVTADLPAVTPEELASSAPASRGRQGWVPWALGAAAAAAGLAAWLASR